LADASGLPLVRQIAAFGCRPSQFLGGL